MNFFKTKQRTPADIVRALRDTIPRLETHAPGSESRRKVCPLYENIKWLIIDWLSISSHKANEDVTKYLQQIKGILLGDGGEQISSLY